MQLPGSQQLQSMSRTVGNLDTNPNIVLKNMPDAFAQRFVDIVVMKKEATQKEKKNKYLHFTWMQLPGSQQL